MDDKYKKLDIDFKISKELNVILDQYIDYLNNGDRKSDDYYLTEIQLELNYCKRENILTDEQIHLLRSYYQYGDILSQGVESDIPEQQENDDIDMTQREC